MFSPPTHLRQAIAEIIRSPVKTLVPPWSWKSATFAAVVRGLAFFATNIKAGEREAVKAFLLEATFAFVTGGMIGAVSQRLRRAQPAWATGMVVSLALPGVMLIAQSGLHHLAHTPHLTGGLILSFIQAAISASFSWYAMRHGAMLGGSDETNMIADFKALPRILIRYLRVVPKLIATSLRKRK
jgi:hypothetical protein